MSKVIKRVFLVLMVIIFAIPLIPVIEVEASPIPSISKKMTLTYYQKGKSFRNAYVVKVPKTKNTDNVKISKVKSSKSKVLKVKKRKDIKNFDYLELKVKKPGKSKVTIKAKVNGKTREIKCDVKIVKYQNPFKTFEIDSKDYSSKFKYSDSQTWSSAGEDELKGILNIVSEKNWKISGIKLVNKKTGKAKKIKNNTEINISAKGKYNLEIPMKNTKTGVKYVMYIDRW